MYVSAFSQFKYSLLALAIASFLFSVPLFVHAQIGNECAFSRTLEMGVDGEDVR
jgi:thiazole synthase ThiGH ThiG subunit